MKKVIGWIVGILVLFIGFSMMIVAETEMLSNSRYTWTPPYTSYEAQVIIVKWVGIALIFWGVLAICLMLYQAMYINKHVQEVNQLTQQGGSIKCANCGLAVAANVDICPRCGRPVAGDKTDNNERSTVCFCTKCGNKIGMDESFCPKCGNKIDQ